HELALYLWDLENASRAERIDILNASNNTVLNSQQMTNFGSPVYAVWNVSGHIVVKVTYTGGINAVLSGIFFKTGAPLPPPPALSLTAPAPGTYNGTIQLGANATAVAGMASVQFKVDNTNIGSPVTGVGPSFAKNWDTTSVSNGTHTL